MASPWEKYKQPAGGPWAKYSTPESTPPPVENVGTIKAAPTGAGAYLQNLESDIRTGSATTGTGRFLRRLGAPGLESGVSKGAGEFVGSPVLGAVHAAQGVAETPQHPVRGALKVAGGVMEALTIPAAFVGPEVAGEKVPGMLTGASRIERAGQAAQRVMAVTKDKPVSVSGAGNIALEIDKLAQSGGSMPKIIRDFIRRTTDPEKGPLTYEEARNFYQNATRLSIDEMNRLTPNVKRLVGKFTSELGQSISQTTSEAGTLQDYKSFMRNYHLGMRRQRQLEALKKYAVKTIPYAAGAYALDRVLSDKKQ